MKSRRPGRNPIGDEKSLALETLNNVLANNEESGFVAKDAIRVVIRIRPMHPREIASGDSQAFRQLSDRKTIHAVINRIGDKETVKQFTFDRVAGPDMHQKGFFEMSGAKELVDAALTGVNVSIFAYGQTGSGKTFSMSGKEELLDRGTYTSEDESGGIIPRAVEHLYRKIMDQPPNAKTAVKAAYAELYNENLYDLLNLTGEPLQLRYSPASQSFFIQGQLVVTCDSPRDILAVLQEGHKNRSVGSHALNADSSRSHSLLTLFIERTMPDPETGTQIVTKSKITFVDLAGSERLKESKAEGMTMVESRQINKSLLALSKVISVLSERKHKNEADHYVPYRDSKLTSLLQDSLGGSAMTLMISCISPASSFVEESMNTLQYSLRASRIENAPVLQIDSKDATIIALRKEVKALKDEVRLLRAKLGIPPLDDIEAMREFRLSRGLPEDGTLEELLEALGEWGLQADEPGGGGDDLRPDEIAPSATALPDERTLKERESETEIRPSGGPVLRMPSLEARMQERGVLRGRVRGRAAQLMAARAGVGSSGAGGVGAGVGRGAGSAGGASGAGAGGLGRDDAARGSAQKVTSFPSRVAGRLSERSERQLVLDAQQADIEELSKEKEKLLNKNAAARARISSLSSIIEEQKRTIERLNDQLQEAQQAQLEAESTVHQNMMLQAAQPANNRWSTNLSASGVPRFSQRLDPRNPMPQDNGDPVASNTGILSTDDAEALQRWEMQYGAPPPLGHDPSGDYGYPHPAPHQPPPPHQGYPGGEANGTYAHTTKEPVYYSSGAEGNGMPPHRNVGHDQAPVHFHRNPTGMAHAASHTQPAMGAALGRNTYTPTTSGSYPTGAVQSNVYNPAAQTSVPARPLPHSSPYSQYPNHTQAPYSGQGHSQAYPTSHASNSASDGYPHQPTSLLSSILNDDKHIDDATGNPNPSMHPSGYKDNYDGLDGYPHTSSNTNYNGYDPENTEKPSLLQPSYPYNSATGPHGQLGYSTVVGPDGKEIRTMAAHGRLPMAMRGKYPSKASASTNLVMQRRSIVDSERPPLRDQDEMAMRHGPAAGTGTAYRNNAAAIAAGGAMVSASHSMPKI